MTILGAAAAGFVGVIVLHGPASQAATLSKSNASASSGNPTSTTLAQQSPSTTAGITTTTLPVAKINGTAVGAQENYGYGQMSVKVTIANSRIVDVSVNSIQALESYSLQLEQQVVPMLKSEVLAAQGTNINSISGATYTTEAYAYSIQSALNKLHFK